jgi:hypothetical protein
MPVAAVPAARAASVWVGQTVPEWASAVREIVAKAGIVVETGPAPGSDALCIVTPLGMDATTACVTQGLDPERSVAIDCFLGVGVGACAWRDGSSPAGAVNSAVRASEAVKILTSCPSCLQGLARYENDASIAADYIVVEMARAILGPDWMQNYVRAAIGGGIERVLL